MLWIYTACSITHLCQCIHCPLGWRILCKGRRRRTRFTTWTEGTAQRSEVGEGWNDAKKKETQTIWTRDGQGAALNQRQRSWEATFPWIYSRSSIWRAALAACVSKEWIQHIINNWCASKHWRYAHMMRMYTFFSWMMHSLVESRQSADNFGQMKYYVFLFGHSCHYTQLDHCAGGRKERIQKWVMKRHVSNL